MAKYPLGIRINPVHFAVYEFQLELSGPEYSSKKAWMAF